MILNIFRVLCNMREAKVKVFGIIILHHHSEFVGFVCLGEKLLLPSSRYKISKQIAI